jgi:hypothetical protein
MIIHDTWGGDVYLLLEQVLEMLLNNTVGSAWIFVVPHEPAVWIALGVLIGAVCMVFALMLANVAGRLCGVAIGVATYFLAWLEGSNAESIFERPHDEHAPSAATAAIHN